MTNTVFIRAFIALGTVLFLIALLGSFAGSAVLHVEERDYWERNLGSFLPELVAQVPDTVWQDSGVPMTRGTVDQFDRWERLRLERLQVISRFSDDQLLLSWQSRSGTGVWTLSAGSGADDIWYRLNDLLLVYWRETGLSGEQLLADLQQRLPFPVHRSELIATRSESRLSPVVMAGQREFYLVNGGRLVLGPMSAPPGLGWPFWVIWGLLSLVAFALVLYWLIVALESGLRNLDQATGRLASGHLSTRVAVRGDDPLNRLGTSFNKMAEHIQRLMGVQREMVRAVSHELRTPVARLRFGMQIIEDVTDDPFVHKQLKGMDSDIQELDQLIDEILTYARLEEGGPLLEFQRASLVEIINQVVDEARPPGAVVVHYEGDDSARTELCELEPRYIHRAIQNLVGNACRYAQTQVLVTCVIGSDTCRVDVDDDGPGIPEEHWNKVFQAFARLDDSRTRSSGGYGLGLSIVRRIAYWHGGRAIVGRSERLGGARFSLVWPRRHVD